MFLDEFRRKYSWVWPQRARFLADDDPDGGGGGDPPDPDPADPPVDPGDESPTDPVEIKKKLLLAIQDAKKYRKRAQAAEAKARDLEGKVVSDEDREELDKLRVEREEEEKRKLEEQGKWTELAAKKDQTHAAAMAKTKAELERTNAALQVVGAKVPLMAALSKAGVQDAETAAFLFQNQFTYRVVATLDASGAVSTTVVDRTGEPALDAEAEGVPPMSITKAVAEWCGTPIGQRFLPPTTDTGSGAHQGRAGGQQVTLAHLDDNPEEKTRLIKEDPETYRKLIQAQRKTAARKRKELRDA